MHPVSWETNSQQLEAPVVAISRYLAAGWRLLADDPVPWIVLSIIYFAILAVLSTTALGTMVALGPLEAGLYAVILKRLRDGHVDIGEFARGFHLFVPSFLIGVIVGAFAIVGFTLLILPGIVVLALYLFAFPFLLDTREDFWNAMELSRKGVGNRWFEWSVFVAVQLLLNFVGVLFCGVGVLVTLPWTKIATAIAYEEHFGQGRFRA